MITSGTYTQLVNNCTNIHHSRNATVLFDVCEQVDHIYNASKQLIAEQRQCRNRRHEAVFLQATRSPFLMYHREHIFLNKGKRISKLKPVKQLNV